MSTADAILAVISTAVTATRDTGLTSHEVAEAAVEALDHAGYVVRKKPKARTAQLLPLPASPGHGVVGKLTDNRRGRMERDWERERSVAKADVAEGRSSRAEIELRQTIALHRSPWTRVSGSRERSNRTYRHVGHPGVTMRQAPDGWRLYRDGERLDGPWPTSVLAEEAAVGLLQTS